MDVSCVALMPKAKHATPPTTVAARDAQGDFFSAGRASDPKARSSYW